ncbi:hypothetical protein GCM10007874_40520 [Labrys miyagiensis]|uniref:SHOCT domain-containing protein n=1 Tax=Labrys miyagiensis TaxID=346912 RepID=A0ABQ6CLI7_9HYPH|nr:hypothetical protein [Labrys miyagiensis]GLS21035.1 hypothetical protein GCM10007874_40520 [Labrys miyagiensis]
MTGDQAASSVDAIAKKFGVSTDAVNAALAALRRGDGSMAQFSHADFGGMAQWSSGGMSMVGDMFNSVMKDKLNGVMQALANGLGNRSIGHEQPGSSSGKDEGSGERNRGRSAQASRWPAEFGDPSSSGSQNDMHYAFFPSSKRLAIEENGRTAFYDTGDHQISGVSQQQSDSRSIRFQSQNGPVSLHDLKPVDPPN